MLLLLPGEYLRLRTGVFNRGLGGGSIYALSYRGVDNRTWAVQVSLMAGEEGSKSACCLIRTLVVSHRYGRG